MENTQLALCDVRGPLDDLNRKLCGDDAAEWLRSFKLFLRHQDPWVVFPTWMKVYVGGPGYGASGNIDLLRCTNRLRYDDHATLHVLEKIVYRPRVFAFNLVRISPWELGFTNDAPTYQEICERAAELNFVLCPPEVAPALRLAFHGDTPTETSCIATLPILDPDHSKSRIFMLECFGDKRFLGNRICNADSRFLPGERLIFARKE